MFIINVAELENCSKFTDAEKSEILRALPALPKERVFPDLSDLTSNEKLRKHAQSLVVSENCSERWLSTVLLWFANVFYINKRPYLLADEGEKSFTAIWAALVDSAICADGEFYNVRGEISSATTQLLPSGKAERNDVHIRQFGMERPVGYGEEKPNDRRRRGKQPYTPDYYKLIRAMHGNLLAYFGVIGHRPDVMRKVEIVATMTEGLYFYAIRLVWAGGQCFVAERLCRAHIPRDAILFPFILPFFKLVWLIPDILSRSFANVNAALAQPAEGENAPLDCGYFVGNSCCEP